MNNILKAYRSYLQTGGIGDNNQRGGAYDKQEH